MDHGHGLGIEVRLAIEEIIQRLQVILEGISKDIPPGFFHLTLHDGDAEIQQLLNFRGHVLKERKHAADVKSPNENLKSSCPEIPGKVGRPGKLVGLDSGQDDDGSPVGRPVGFNNPAHGNFFNGIVEDLDSKFDSLAKQLPPRNILGKAGQAGECVAREYAPKVTNHVSIIIVFGWLDEDDAELLSLER
jgi:hypothetical protein